MIRSRYLPLLATVIIFLLAYALCYSQYPTMLSTRVIGNLLTDNAFLGIAAVGMTFVIFSGGIDLSVGAVIAFTGVFIAVLLANTALHPLVVFALALVITTLFGALMGVIIHYLDMPAFIVTLAGMFLARGMAFVLSTDSVPVKHEFYTLLQESFFRLPGGGRLTMIGIIMLLVFLIGTIVAHRTRFGTYVFALGGKVQAAKLMGVPVAKTTIRIYAISGFLAGLSGITFSLYTSAGYSLAAVGVELDAIAAVVIGGALLTGGSGFIVGTLIGVLIMGLIQTFIIFDGSLSSWWTKILIGILLFVFILMQKTFLWLSSHKS
ncbi:sugar ABC transporter permease YjfF [Amphritea atlantica]|uniref:Sugar ABC transporter permease YjfF n=1 Tax=Amphritea atlantica TaxID=355243 RepID=A0ABY5GZJ5_9GAMM|nr:sugar ABC transporter permease YjfF [Amphritea atlantica]